jgi:hypothetical protein
MNEEVRALPEKLAGGCMCGAVRYRISGVPMVAALCHCDRCRSQSGSAFSTVIIIKRSTITLEGETAVFEGHRLKRPAGGAPLLPALRLAAHDRTGCGAGGDDGESGRHRFKRMIPPGHGTVRRRPWVTPVPGAQQFESNPPL